MLGSKRFRLLGTLLAAATGCTATQNDTYSSQMSAGQSGVQSTAVGSAQFTLHGTRVDYTLNVAGLNSRVLAVHIHEGEALASGPRRVDLFLGPTTGIPDGELISGSFNAADVDGLTFRELISAMRTGLMYVNVHTDDVRPGEMRGQIFLEGAAAASSITGPAQ